MATTSEIKDAVADIGKRPIEGPDDWTCRITLVNACPPDWNVHIVAGSADFFYRDGSSEQNVPVTMDLTAGQSYVFTSGNPSECVEKVLNVISVVVPGTPAQTIQSASDPIPADQCLMSDTVKLEPKHNTVRKDNAASELRSREIVLNRLTSY